MARLTKKAAAALTAHLEEQQHERLVELLLAQAKHDSALRDRLLLEAAGPADRSIRLHTAGRSPRRSAREARRGAMAHGQPRVPIPDASIRASNRFLDLGPHFGVCADPRLLGKHQAARN